MDTIQSNKKELFGGAMEFEIPKAFIDVSTIRELPDN